MEYEEFRGKGFISGIERVEYCIQVLYCIVREQCVYVWKYKKIFFSKWKKGK